MRALSVCCPILKLYNIDSRVLWARVLWRIAFLLLVLLAGVDFSVAYTLGGTTVSASMIYWRWMFRAAMRGDQHGGATVWAVGTFGDHCGGGTLGIYIPVSTTLCVVLEGMGGYR